ncbi:MAG TPA: hypothetical protein DCQ28_02420 [Bacteroidetes bacterium]|nr:hypothetical protein [Bacteroidota bacterium]
MIPLIIFYVHIVGISAAFTSEYQKEGIGAAFLSIGFIVLIFSVGWTISTFILKYMMTDGGFGLWLNRDAFSLLLLTIGEAIFYLNYFNEEKNHRTVR